MKQNNTESNRHMHENTDKNKRYINHRRQEATAVYRERRTYSW